MADFPAIEPTRRSYDLGRYAMSSAGSFSGSMVRFNHATVATGFKLTLAYDDLPAADVTALRTHEREQDGGYLSFQLPAAIWAGHPDPWWLAPETDRWIYDGPIDEGPAKPGGFHDVTVTLRHVGPELGF